MDTSEWYLAIAGETQGPERTESLLARLERGEVPESAFVCEVGAQQWQPIASVPPFADSMFPRAGDSEVSDEPGSGDERQSQEPCVPDASGFDWTEPLAGYLRFWPDRELPSDTVLLDALRTAPPEVLIQQQAVWNLGLCVALGSDSLARAARAALYETLLRFRRPDRLAWLLRALRGKGFVTNNLPESAAARGIRLLMEACPEALLGADEQGSFSVARVG